jgi:hypothetical protein
MLRCRRHQAHVPVHGTIAEVSKAHMVVEMAETDCCRGKAWGENREGECYELCMSLVAVSSGSFTLTIARLCIRREQTFVRNTVIFTNNP